MKPRIALRASTVAFLRGFHHAYRLVKKWLKRKEARLASIEARLDRLDDTYGYLLGRAIVEDRRESVLGALARPQKEDDPLPKGRWDWAPRFAMPSPPPTLAPFFEETKP
jgi:hypothetical protein